MSEYEKQAEDFLKLSNTKITIQKTGTVQGFPNGQDNMLHDRYYVTLSRNGYTYGFPFYGSQHDHQTGKTPSHYDILACLQSYEVCDDVWDFAKEFGYEIKDKETFRNVNKIWSKCRSQYQSLCQLFDENLMRKLAEIQ